MIRRVGKSTSGVQRKSKCVAKFEKAPLFGVKVRIKKKRPGTDFVSIPGSFMCNNPNFEMLRPPGVVFPVKGVAFSPRGVVFALRGALFSVMQV